MTDVAFALVKSLVDLPFFSELSKHKLEYAKLSTDAIDLRGFIEVPVSLQRPPLLRLTADSFDAATSSDNRGAAQNLEYSIPGRLWNTNTIDDFRDVDKIKLLKGKVKELAIQIENGEAVENPALLFQFFLLTFSDLKKYKFYYWFMFPAFKWTSRILQLDREASSKYDDVLKTVNQPVCLFNGTEPRPLTELTGESKNVTLGLTDFGTVDDEVPWALRNIAALLAHKGVERAELYIYRASGGSRWISLEVGAFTEQEWQGEGSQGWERNAQNKLTPKVTDLSSLMNPLDLADQATGLNLKLMKWRAAPQIDLDAIASKKCLLLGAGTLGSYVSRGLLAWGVRHITFVDSGKVSYSNPVRQPLYTHKDCVEQSAKAEAAANALKQIFPLVVSSGHVLEIPMAGHPITSEERQHKEYTELVELIKQHDVIFLLLDSREARWLPTVISQALNKATINVALGYDSYLVMRHGVNRSLGCYFCNDVLAPSDSTSRQPLDQMCTVTRPGGAMIASGAAVELFAQISQDSSLLESPAGQESVLGLIPHQVRGFLSNYEVVKLWGPAFGNCSACGPSVELWKELGWEFVKRALNDTSYISDASGLSDIHRATEELSLTSDSEAEMV